VIFLVIFFLVTSLVTRGPSHVSVRLSSGIGSLPARC
jgi:hypothetical protein